MRRVVLVGLALVLSLASGCAGCGDETSASGETGDAVGGDGTLGDGFSTADGSGDGAVAADGDGGGSATAGDGGTTSDGGSGSGGSDRCSGTETWCKSANACVSTRLNPDHCGTCGNSCGSNEVCNGGKCVGQEDVGCPQGMEPCGRRCVDKDTNDNHCGDCNNACPSGKACGNGRCIDKVDVDPGPKNCNGGPDIDIGFSDKKKVCSGKIAKTTFKWTICSCDELSLFNNIFADAYNSQKGPYTPKGYGGGFGSNGAITLNKADHIYGSVYTSSEEGVRSDVALRVHQQLHSQGDTCWGPTALVDGNVRVGGNIESCTGGGPGSGGAPIEFNQNLYIPSSSNISNRVQVAKQTINQNVNVSTVCSRCKQGNQIPVQQIVDHHSKDKNNDNDVIGLDETALDNPGKEVVLKLPCGRYYLNKIDIETKVTIVATGDTALFVGDGVDVQSDFTIKPTPSGELDVFVNGKINLNNNNQIGSPAYPAYMRFYANGPVTVKNDTVTGAYIYAIPGGVTLQNNLDYYGGLYTQNLTGMNNPDFHYDREVLQLDKDCPEDDPGGGSDADGGMSGSDGGGSTMDGGGGSDGGSDGGSTCTSQGGDCSADSECCNDLLCDNGTCGSTCSESGGNCSQDSDCCSPLVCDNGTCASTECKTLFEPCQGDSECCSLNCGSNNTCQSG